MNEHAFLFSISFFAFLTRASTVTLARRVNCEAFVLGRAPTLAFRDRQGPQAVDIREIFLSDVAVISKWLRVGWRKVTVVLCEV